MKKLISIIIVCVMIMSKFTFTPLSASAATEGYYTYTVSNGEATITKADKNISGDISIPSTLGGYPVTTIGFSAFLGCDNLTSVEIPQNVNTIRHSAFTICSNIKNVILSDGLERIEDNAFGYCYTLNNIVIPKSVVEIGTGVFDGCYDMESIKVSADNNFYCDDDGVLVNKEKTTLIRYPVGKMDEIYVIDNDIINIENSAFFNCTNLTKVIIPKSVETIGEQVFSSYHCLESIEVVEGNENYCDEDGVLFNKAKTNLICYPVAKTDAAYTIPYSVEKISSGAFLDTECLTDIYYSGTKEEWEKISIEYGNECLENATIHFNSYIPEQIVPTGPYEVSGKPFKFSSGLGKGTFNYDDKYFNKSSYIYNHDLARLSMRVALAAYGKKDYSNAYKNIEQMMKDMKFDEDSISYNEWYDKKPITESIGVIIGKKYVEFSDDNYTLIAVAIRGGGYEAEWGGNFNVGTEKHHAGFEQAKKQVVEYIKNYVKSNKIGGKVKLWITGYSRAAATTNLTAAYFDENPSEIGSMVTLAPKDIYAYCFETPMGVRNPDNASGLYNNIFSIVNQHDFVPMVAMRKWGYDRYGITKYLPSAYTHSNYMNDTKTGLIDQMKENYKKYSETNYVVDDFLYEYVLEGLITDIKQGLPYGQGVFLDITMDKLADAIGSPANYTANYQHIFEYIGEEVVGKNLAKPLADSFIKEFNKRKWIFYTEAGGMIYSVLNPFIAVSGIVASGSATYLTLRSLVKDTFDNVDIYVNETVLDGLTKFVVDLGVDDAYTLFKNINSIAQSHAPELCMAWLDTIKETDFTDKRLRTLYLNCPVDLEVYDSNDKLVAAIYNNVPQKIEDSSIVAYVDENGQKVVYLPTDEEYRTKVIATDDGEVAYSVQEQNIDTGETRVINYNSMTVSKNDTLTGKVEKISDDKNAQYSLTSESVTVSEAEVIEDAQPISVITDITGNGNVSGDGKFYKGEFAQLTAMPLENETFIGWYNEETLLSKEETYRFRVEEETTITAKFSENTCLVVMVDDEDYAVKSVRRLKNSRLDLTDIPVKEGYTFVDYYVDKAYTTLVKSTDVFAEDTMIYTKWVKNIDIKQTSYSDEKITISGIMADSMVEKSGKVLILLYEDGKMVKSAYKEPTKNFTYTVENVENPENEYDVKILYWEALSVLKPFNTVENFKIR